MVKKYLVGWGGSIMLLFASAASFGQSKTAKASYSFDLNVSQPGINISPTLNGIFYEDINQSNDGGISAQLIQNNSFQVYKMPGGSEKESSNAPANIFGWTVVKNAGAEGTATTVDEKPLVKYSKYYDFDPNDKYDDELKYKQYSIRFDIQKPGNGFGLAANGYGVAPYGPEKEGNYYSVNTQVPSIAVKAGIKYDLGLHLLGQQYKGNIKVYLEDAKGNKNSNVVTYKGLTDSWKKFSGRLVAQRSEDSRLAIIGDAAGVFYLDFVTLIPEASQLWQNGKAGAFRKDMLDALQNLKPSFMRFPGGCAAEGPNYWGQVFWKNTIGPLEERIGARSHWGTWVSQHIGFYEYLCMSEALGAKPLPVLNNGVTCQFAGHSYVAPLETDEQRKRFYDIYVKDALDLIEFCNGDANTKWGAKRIALGHAKPFNLEYLAIGNENRGDAFWERFDIIYNAVREKYPHIKVITTSGAFDAGREFNTNYKIIDEKYAESIVDEHYYKNDNWFYANTHRYDPGQVRGDQKNTYDRAKPTRVFVGEFANNGTNNAYMSTLAEAAFFTGLERNSDMVELAAYAPLFCKKGFNKWNSNLIWFDNRGLWRTTNYYYMALFSNNTGNKTFKSSPFVTTADKSEDTTIFISPSINTNDGIIYVKLVNAENKEKITDINLKGVSQKKYKASIEYISSEDKTIKNQGDQNYYAGATGLKEVSYVEPIRPKKTELGTISDLLQLTIPLNSVCVIKLVPVK